MGTRGVQRSLQLFLQFPFNNVLHRHVAALVTAVDAASARLAQFLAQDCGLLSWLVDAPTEVRLRGGGGTGMRLRCSCVLAGDACGVPGGMRALVPCSACHGLGIPLTLSCVRVVAGHTAAAPGR